MSLKSFSKRHHLATDCSSGSSVDLITVDNPSITNTITEWLDKTATYSGVYTFADFAYFIKNIGEDVPISLSNYSNTSNAFVCKNRNHEFVISLGFTGCDNEFATISVNYENESKTYVVSRSYPSEDISLNIISRNINKNGNKYEFTYKQSEHECRRKVVFENGDILNFNILNPFITEKSTFSALRNSNSVEAYLLSLNSSMIFNDVHQELMRRLNYTSGDLSICHKISISLEKNLGNKHLITNLVTISYGKIESYISFDGKAIYSKDRAGNWSYISNADNTEINLGYDKRTNMYSFSIIGDKTDLSNNTFKALIKKIELKLSDMSEKMK